MTDAEMSELVNLYHLANSVLDHPTRYSRLMWASDKFADEHHDTKSHEAYRVLDFHLR